MHVSKKRRLRSRVLVWCAAVVAICAQAAAFFSCSYGTATSVPVVPPPVHPTVSINVAPGTITLGQSALLSWSANGVSACTASGAWSGSQSLQGSLKVTPATTGTLAYVLNCTVVPSGSVAQSATLIVNAMGALSRSRLESSRGHLTVRRTDLVADLPGVGALVADPNLSEPWGLVLPAGLPAVVASRKSNTSTSYDGLGRARPGADPLRLRLPFDAEGPAEGAAGAVANASDGFVVSAAGKSAPARLLYASTGGAIAAWSPEIDAGRPIIVQESSDSVAYTGLAIATSSTPGEGWLYAADFRNGRIDVFDSDFRRQVPTATTFAFTDPALPPGYAPFGVAVMEQLVYVAYARRPEPFIRFPVTGHGLGLVDVFTSDGVFITRLVPAGGVLNAPWAMVAVPDAHALSRALLVGNTGDGTIDAFEPESGTWLGALHDEGGAVLVVARLHGLAFGNDSAAQPRSTLFFSAGPSRGAQGWYGRIDFDAALTR
jgi:uncharacterized protein (TIGR03118 family)